MPDSFISLIFHTNTIHTFIGLNILHNNESKIPKIYNLIQKEKKTHNLSCMDNNNNVCLC